MIVGFVIQILFFLLFVCCLLFFFCLLLLLCLNILSHPWAEPYNYFGRRGRKEPEALAAASLKRLFVQNQPYLVGGYSQHAFSGNSLPSSGVIGSKFSSTLQRLKTSELDTPKDIRSMAEKYTYMKETFRKRLAFGKN